MTRLSRWWHEHSAPGEYVSEACCLFWDKVDRRDRARRQGCPTDAGTNGAGSLRVPARSGSSDPRVPDPADYEWIRR